MAPSVSISILVVALALCFIMHDTTNMVIIAPGFVAASVSLSPALQLEAKAVRESEWWSTSAYSNKSHCQWNGIKCNDEGSVTEINMGGTVHQLGDKVRKFNFSSFPNLVRLDLKRTGIWGSIPVDRKSVV